MTRLTLEDQPIGNGEFIVDPCQKPFDQMIGPECLAAWEHLLKARQAQAADVTAGYRTWFLIGVKYQIPVSVVEMHIYAEVPC